METTRPTVARSRIAWRCTFLACLLTASFAAAAHLPAIANAPTSAAAGVLVRTAQDLTLAVIEANARLAGAEPVDRGRRLDALVAAARERQDALLALLDADPEEALRVVLPADLRSRMPAQATSYLEQNVEEDGAVDVYHVDHADAALDRYVYVLTSPRSGKLTLRFARNAPALRSGNQVHVSGVRIGDTLLAASGGSVTSTKAARTTSTQQSTLGAQKVLTILVNFTDDASQPFTVASAQSMMFNTVSNYWYEASYQQTTLAGDVAGWYTIPLSTTGCDYNSIASYAQSAASKAGYVLSHYTRFLYVFPGSTCSWWGMSQIGGNPSQSWIAAQSGFSLVVIGHELGHALGLYHSHSLDCGNVELAASGCTESEYGDLFDIMGGPGGKTPHYNAFQKEQLGWLNAGSSPPITTVPVQEGSADYAIGPLEAAADATPRALKIARPAACGATADYLYVEARQAIGFDAFLSGNANVLSGVLVHDATPGNLNSSHLLDMTPATTSWTDPALDAGVTFVDSASGMTMTPLSAGGSATTINLAFPATSCVHAAPGITLAPGDTQYSTAGSTTTYSVSVTNNDTCGCAASTFDVSASVPTGWTAGLARTGSIAPGTSGSVAFTITSAASAIAAFYAIPSTAANTAAPNFAGQTDATIAVIDGLAVSTTSDKTAYVRPAKRNQSVYAMITSSVTAAGTMVSGATVSVTVISPGGGSTTLSGTTGSDGLMYASYAIKSSSPPGVYSVTSIATLGQVSNTGTTTFTIQ